jgi:small subunit ribosomal protein S9
MPNTESKLQKGFITGTGRRKTATARVFLWQDKGDITVNGVDIEKFFPSEKEQTKWVKPFHAVGVSHPKAKFSASIKVAGSGKAAQLGAVMHGIARALAKVNDENSVILHKLGLLTRDSRMVERKKPYLHKARKAPQYSKR